MTQHSAAPATQPSAPVSSPPPSPISATEPVSARRLHLSPAIACKLALGTLLLASFVAFYAMLPIASLGLLPIFIGCVSYLSATLEEMGFR